MIVPNVSPYPVDDKQLVLIPLFGSCYHFTDPRHKNFQADNVEHLTNLAVWSWYSWRENTDAKEYGVPCKVYLQDILEPYTRPIFEKHGLDWNQDILTWTQDKVDYARLSQFACPLYDEQLKYYEQLILSDVDVFIPRTKINFFERYERFGNKHAQGFLMMYFQTNAGMRDTSRQSYLSYLERSHIDKCGIGVLEHVLEVYNDITGKSSKLDFFLNPDSELMWNSSGIWIYPARWTHENQKDMIAWLEQCALDLGNDEIIATTAYHLFRSNIFNITEQFGMTHHRHIGTIKKLNIDTIENSIIHGKDIVHLLDKELI